MNLQKNKFIYIISCVFIVATQTQSFPQSAQAIDPWQHWRFLLGEWVATGTGQPGEGVGHFSFTYDLDKKVLVRKSRVDYPPKPGEKTGLSHKDLLIVYQPPGDSLFRAVYFDNEGHSINYAASFPETTLNAATLESEPSQKGPRFRLAYEMNADGTLQVSFSIALPGESFKIYTQGIAHRKP